MNALPPVLLLHGVTNSARIWDEVVPFLADEYEVIVPTFAGHRGGARCPADVSINALVDEAEAILDGRRLDRVHVAGNSMGGWVALELARRGRALSVCAFSPAGMWTPGDDDEKHATRQLRRSRWLAHSFSALTPALVRVPWARRLMLAPAAHHGERVSAAMARTIIDDLLGCTAAPALLAPTEQIAPLENPSCPVTLAWSGRDALFPSHINGKIAQQRIPTATYVELPDVGHVPMLDDAELCATTMKNTFTQA